MRKYFFVLAVLGCSVGADKRPQIPDSNVVVATPPENASGLRAAVTAFFSTATPSQWTWPPAGPVNVEIYMKSLAATEHQKVEKMFRVNAGIPRVDSIRKVFAGKIAVGFYDIRKNDADFPTDSAMLAKGALRLWIYPEVVRRAGIIHHALIMYDSNHNSLFIPGLVTNSETWEQARILHELYHALEDKTGGPGAHAPGESAEWMLEEADAHGVARAVLDRGTHGKYSKTTESVAKTKTGSNCSEVIEQITPEDFMKIDDVFGRASIDEEENRAAQYVLDICLARLRLSHPGELTKEEKAEAYRAMQSHAG